MGTLARNSEIVAMRAAGMSKSRMVVAALGGGMLVVALALLVGEYLAPGLEQLADQRKALAKYNDISFAVRGGAWLRDGNRIINVDSQSGALRFGGLTVFELGEGATLASVGHATHANNPGTGEWQLSDYRETRFERERVLSTRQASTTFATPNSGGFTQLAVVQPRQMSLTSLRMAIEYTHSNTLSASGYEFEFWSRMARTLALWVAMVFAVPFGFGLLRAAGTGARAALGLGIGLLYFFLQQIVGSAATLFALNPLMLAWVPTMLLIGAASFLLWRAR
jgi:lipopolysaccharide export system permease protein